MCGVFLICGVVVYWMCLARVRSVFLYLFFFQAEDGIRDVAVTGVQTCALPISASGRTVPICRTARLPPSCRAARSASNGDRRADSLSAHLRNGRGLRA